MKTETRMMEHTHGHRTGMALHRAFYTVELHYWNTWKVLTSHRDIEIAKAEANRQVRLSGHKRETIRIKRRWIVIK